MLTRNGKALLFVNKQYNRASIALVATDGTIQTFSASASDYYNKIYANNKLVVGTDSGEPTVDDSNMIIDSNLTVVSRSNTTNNSASYANNYILSCTATFKNSTNNPITIRQVGIVTDSNSYIFLMAKEKISSVTIQPQHTYTFSLTIG